jgi:hypothetical protein
MKKNELQTLNYIGMELVGHKLEFTTKDELFRRVDALKFGLQIANKKELVALVELVWFCYSHQLHDLEDSYLLTQKKYAENYIQVLAERKQQFLNDF